MMMTAQEFAEFIGRQKFHRAVTAKRNPHEYIVRHRNVCGTDEEFIRACYFIRQNGFKIVFWGREYIVYALDNHFYWTMDEDITKTQIMNRNDLNDYTLVLRSKFE